MRRLAHFKGKYNKSKSKVLILLYDEPSRWFSVREMHFLLGVPIGSIRNIVRRLYWCRPPYVKRRLIGSYYPGPYRYEWQIGVRGERWYTNAFPFMPVDEYVKEVKAWQRQRDSQIRVGEGGGVDE